MDEDLRHFFERLESGVEPTDNAALVPHGKRPCPICGQPMLVVVEHGIYTDVCTTHGVWLDAGELGAIISRVRTRESLSQSQAVRAAKKDGIWKGASFGMWAFLFDD